MRNIKAPAWMALAGMIAMAVMTVIVNAANDHTLVDGQQFVQIGIAAVTAFNVWATANLPGYEHMKKGVAVVLLVLQGLFVAVVGGVSSVEYMNLGIAALASLGVLVIPSPITTTRPGGEVMTRPGR